MRSLLGGLVALSAVSFAAPPAKKKAPTSATPAAVPVELKPAPVIQPVPLEPTPAPAPRASTPSPPLVAPIAVVRPVEVEPELTPLPKLTRGGGLSVQATGGVVVPFSGFGPGGRAEVRASYWLARLPLAASLGVAFEQHTSHTATFFAPPSGGLDERALDNQTLLPFEAGVRVAVFRDERNRVHLGAGYALLSVWSQTVALGDTVLERGVGHEVSGEAGYTRLWGALELTLNVRYSVRRTAVGPRTSSIELPWYQAFGVVAGVGFFL